MLTDAEMARVREQPDMQAKITSIEGVGLFAPPLSLALQSFLKNLAAGEELTEEELALLAAAGTTASTTENEQSQSRIYPKENDHGSRSPRRTEDLPNNIREVA